uniref:Solute carrier family 17 member 1 n=1 Tax=Mustela putorius furo TaxID=9669 RepID=M3YBH8_MUSPF
LENETVSLKFLVPNFCSFRYGLSLLLHFCNVIITAQRTCLSLTMVAMVNSTDAHGLANTTTGEHLDHSKNPVYNWNPQIQGFIFSSIFYGALITQIPAGYLSEKYSIKKMIGFAFLLSSLLSLLMPMAAEGGEAFLLACRVAQGAAQGLISIAQHVVWVKWAPPLERGRLTSLSLSGILLGSFIVLLVTGFICQSLGWPMAFYIFGKSLSITSHFFFLTVFLNEAAPQQLYSSSKNIIHAKCHFQVSSRTQSLPIKAMIKSLPVWAIALGSFAFHWTNNIMVFYTPTFINSKLRVNIKENGLLSALPSLFAWSFGILAGHLTDFFLSRNILSNVSEAKTMRSMAVFPILYIPNIIYKITYTIYTLNQFLSPVNITLIFSTGFTDFLIVLAFTPSYYGFLKGITTLIGMIGGLTSSTLCGVILNQDPESAWFKIFFLMAVINVICLLFCLVFGKAEIQDWAKDRQEHTRL